MRMLFVANRVAFALAFAFTLAACDDLGESADAGSSVDAGGPPADSGVDGSVHGPGGLDCGAHSTLHGGDCHCEDGYRFDGTSCVPLDACDDDAREDDDTFRAATPWSDELAELELVACPADDDWFAIEMSAGVRYVFLAEATGGDVDLVFYRPGADPRFSGPDAVTSGADGSARLVHTARDDGTAYLVIEAASLDARATCRLVRTTDPA